MVRVEWQKVWISLNAFNCALNAVLASLFVLNGASWLFNALVACLSGTVTVVLYRDWKRELELREMADQLARDVGRPLTSVEMATAERRARTLLLEHLDEQQRRMYEEAGYFTVRAQSGRRYTLTAGGVSEGARAFCIQLPYEYPPSDAVLARKLLLETDEGAFRRIACW